MKKKEEEKIKGGGCLIHHQGKKSKRPAQGTCQLVGGPADVAAGHWAGRVTGVPCGSRADDASNGSRPPLGKAANYN